jgi:hypothetical protein
MISKEILSQLVPQFEARLDFEFNRRLEKLEYDDPVRNISLWSAYLRHRIQIELLDNRELRERIERSGFIATGIFRTPRNVDYMGSEYFPIIEGYQFGMVILQSDMDPNRNNQNKKYSEIYLGNYSVPIVEFQSGISPHISNAQGHVAALFEDGGGNVFGITAAHVVNGYRKGQAVDVYCSACGASAILTKKAPGLLDAAIVKFSCGGAIYNYNPSSIELRPALEGESVSIYFGESGTRTATVMLSLQTPTEILSAATPKHFLIDEHGHPGDSGSLVAAADSSPHDDQELLGIYLGETDCEDGNQRMITYGYALDLKQAADIFRISIKTGEFNE